MVKNTLKYIFVIFLSIFSVYVLSDKIILPYILYVDEVSVPDLINHDISTAKILLDKNRLKMNIQYVASDKDDILGRIIDNHPRGKIVKVGTAINLKVLG